MGYKNIFITIFTIVFLVNIISLYFTIRPNRSSTLRNSIIGILIGTIIWTLMELIVLIGVPLQIEKILVYIEYVGINTVLVCWPIFVLEYRGYNMREKIVPLYSLIVGGVLCSVIISTNSLHGLMWTQWTIESKSYGPFFWVFVGYTYTIITSGSLLLVYFTYVNDAIFKKQGLLILLATIAPTIMNMYTIIFRPGYDLAVVGIGITCVAISLAINKYELGDVRPIAQETILNNLNEGILVKNSKGEVINYNSKAKELMELSKTNSIRKFANVVSENKDTYKIEHTDSGEIKNIDIEEIPIYRQKDDIGTVIKLNDVTDIKRKTRQLEEQNERLEDFVSFLSHDLKNPISIILGYSEQAKKQEDVSHVQQIENAANRMHELIDDTKTLVKSGKVIENKEVVCLEEISEKDGVLSIRKTVILL